MNERIIKELTRDELEKFFDFDVIFPSTHKCDNMPWDWKWVLAEYITSRLIRNEDDIIEFRNIY